MSTSEATNWCTFSHSRISSCIVTTSLLTMVQQKSPQPEFHTSNFNFSCMFVLIRKLSLDSRSMCFRSRNPKLCSTISHVKPPGCSQEPGIEHLKELAKISRTGRCLISISRWGIYYNRLLARNLPLKRKSLEVKSLQRFPSEALGYRKLLHKQTQAPTPEVCPMAISFQHGSQRWVCSSDPWSCSVRWAAASVPVLQGRQL